MNIDLTMEEILEDLCDPGLPPGRWNVPRRREAPWSAAILHEAGEPAGDSARRRRSVQDSAGSLPAPR
jgi:hypothetical protein